MLSRWFFIVILMIVGVYAKALKDDVSEKSVTDSGHQGGRVQIKVFRGPTEQDGKESYAPWGYWVKQPADHYQ
ncbi:hypothetical protein GWI33_014554 [Rhynchophorus ferrugineus]|uniref:Secreted protein n=1 Tax=Rhynchophorus ferrugineus TaxID=354439 RepID=A0A834I4U0_RHYFE|nr:hypothetical protein GWI33_014554 [Rhynchophorus ferrugineus]